MTTLIGVSGKLGSGKDEFVTQLNAAVVGERFVRHAFADPLKAICAILTGSTAEEQQTQHGKNQYSDVWQCTHGQLQQRVGTDVFRAHFDTDCWIKVAQAQLNAERARGRRCVFADVRFPNEADWVLANGGLLFRMEGDPAGVRAASQRDLTHASETALDAYTRWTAVIDNTGSVDQLRGTVRDIVCLYGL